MKKSRIGLFGIIAIASASLAMAFGGTRCKAAMAVDSEPASSQTIPEGTGHVSIEKPVNGTILCDVDEGPVGTVVTILAKADVLYKVEFVKVNGISLGEDSEISGKFTFGLAEGENVITSSFVVDDGAAAGIAKIIEQIKSGDWTQIFSVENVLTIVKWILDGGVLIAFARYFIKNKRLESKVESKVQETMEKIVPSQTKDAVLDTVEKVIKPIFSEVKTDSYEMKKALAVFSKCMALSQDGSPESRKAIIDELATVSISDTATLESVKKYIDGIMAEHEKNYRDAMKAIEEIGQKNREIIEVDSGKEEAESPKGEDSKYGTL